MRVSLASLALLIAPITAIAAQPLTIGVAPKAKDSPYWNVVKGGVMKAKADLEAQGVTVNILWDAPAREDQTEEQKQVVASFVAKKVDAIVLAPSSAQILAPAADQAKAAGIPVVVIDSLINTESPVSVVATNNYKAGLLAGRRIAEVLNGNGNVALFRFVKGHGSTQPRESGFLDALKKFPGIKVISSDFISGATKEEAQKNANALLQKFGAELNAVFAPNLPSSEGMLAALRDTKLAGKIAFVGFDSTDELVDGLRKGELAGLTVQQPFRMGYLGVTSAVAAAQKKAVEKEVDTEVMMVTKDNLDTPEVKKLLNP